MDTLHGTKNSRDMTTPEHIELLQAAIDAAYEAGKITLSYFQSSALTVETKTDQSPVTIADRSAEEYLRGHIRRRFPDHGILGEEFGEETGASPYRWILDPIDGTKSFVCGVPLYGTMVAVEDRRLKDAVVGVLNFPALGDMVWAARGHGSYWNGRRVHTSGHGNLNAAVLLTTDAGHIPGSRFERLYQQLASQTKFTRTWGDCYGHALVASGRADIMIDPKMHIWDVAAIKPVIEEAGGLFMDSAGRSDLTIDHVVAVSGRLAPLIRNMLA